MHAGSPFLTVISNGRPVVLMQGLHVDIGIGLHAVVVRVVQDIVLGARGAPAWLLHSTHVGSAHLAEQYRIFAVGLLRTRPARVAEGVDHRRESKARSWRRASPCPGDCLLGIRVRDRTKPRAPRQRQKQVETSPARCCACRAVHRAWGSWGCSGWRRRANGKPRRPWRTEVVVWSPDRMLIWSVVAIWLTSCVACASTGVMGVGIL